MLDDGGFPGLSCRSTHPCRIEDVAHSDIYALARVTFTVVKTVNSALSFLPGCPEALTMR